MPRTTAKRLSLRAICISVVTFTTVAVTAGVAWAAYTDNMYPTQHLTQACFSVSGPAQPGFCQTDNRDLTYYMDSSGSNALEAVDRAVVNDVMSRQYNPTDLSVSYDSTPVFSGSAETDVVYEESSAGLPSSLDGYTSATTPPPRSSATSSTSASAAAAVTRRASSATRPVTPSA
jgi:hypothetical protein